MPLTFIRESRARAFRFDLLRNEGDRRGRYSLYERVWLGEEKAKDWRVYGREVRWRAKAAEVLSFRNIYIYGSER